jgi:glycosyltransferase involved in cell wall biosynthesis
MGCAGNLLPPKTNYKKRNHRHFLHVSHLGPAKNIPLMLKSIKGLGVTLFVASRNLRKTGPASVKFSNIDGATESAPIHSLGPISNNDPQLNHFLIEHCDFYIHTSAYDAQATAVLENCARGLVPMVTPECGFNCPHAIILSHNPEHNQEIIQDAMHMSEEEYAYRSRGVREFVLKHHSWEKIYGRVWQVIQADQNAQPFDTENFH